MSADRKLPPALDTAPATDIAGEPLPGWRLGYRVPIVGGLQRRETVLTAATADDARERLAELLRSAGLDHTIDYCERDRYL